MGIDTCAAPCQHQELQDPKRPGRYVTFAGAAPAEPVVRLDHMQPCKGGGIDEAASTATPCAGPCCQGTRIIEGIEKLLLGQQRLEQALAGRGSGGVVAQDSIDSRFVTPRSNGQNLDLKGIDEGRGPPVGGRFSCLSDNSGIYGRLHDADWVKGEIEHGHEVIGLGSGPGGRTYSLVPMAELDSSDERIGMVTGTGGMVVNHVNIVNLAMPMGWPTTVTKRASMASSKTSSDGAKVQQMIAGLRQQGARIRITKSPSNLPFHNERAGFSCRPIEPSSSTRILLDIACLFFLMYDITTIPIILAWDIDFGGWVKWGTTVSLVFWMMDMFLSFSTGFYHKGELEMRRREIAKHYIKTFFFLDLIIISFDWVKVIYGSLGRDETDMDSMKILRISKISRMMRLVGVLRMVRVREIGERLEDWGCASGFSNLGLEIFKVLVFLLWCNHLMACMWLWLGNLVSSDTGNSWLHEPITAGGDAIEYEQSPAMYQYLSAFHWSLTQMTPGSMQVSAHNSPERIFNICCLVFGLLFFSSLVSSLSAKMMGIKMLQKEKTDSLRIMHRFLRQNDVTAKLAVKLKKQVLERLASVKPLTVKDVPVLRLLSLSLRSELSFELCRPHLLEHPFFRLWDHMDRAAMHKISLECIDWVILHPGDNLFLPGANIGAAYYCISGELKYVQDPQTSFVPKRCEATIGPDMWICEAALWSEWLTVGTVEAVELSQLLCVHAERVHQQMHSGANVIGIIGQAYTDSYHSRICSAVPPRAVYPNDLQVPFTSFGEILVSFPHDVREVVGLVALEYVRQERWHWQNTKRLWDLEAEVRRGETVLMMCGSNAGAELLRVVTVSALRLERPDGHFLVQVGMWSSEHSRAVPCTRLPGTKQVEGELPKQALQRLFSQELAPFAVGSCVSRSQLDVQSQTSQRYGIRTKYIRTVHIANYDPGDHVPEVPFMEEPFDPDPASRPCNSTAFILRTNLGLPAFYAWLSEEELESMRGAGAKRHSNWIGQLRLPTGFDFTTNSLRCQDTFNGLRF